MTTPRNSMSGAFPAGPIAMQPVQKLIPRRVPSVVGATQSFFMRESKALGAVQIMNGLFHIALGGLLLIHVEVYAPICVTLWYPLWGGIMYIISGSLLAAVENNSMKSLVRGRIIMNSLSLFAAISGIIFLIMDIFNLTISHFFKMESLNLTKAPTPHINIYNCEPANPTEKNSLSMQYCDSIRFLFLGNFAVMLLFAFLQKLVTAGTVENEWKKICSRPKANVVLLSAEEKKEQTIEIKEEVVEQIEISSQPKNEEDIEIIPVQEEEEEEEEETEINFPEPPQDQEASPIENDSVP
ncbi:B-lymphocyte antigen CD20-like [Balaenoptera musculus]|uniref:B-lymphocyte antigen CD20-like n=1 Tax=Balaenoptera musculus TaxID=9771 RepID=A0A8B8Y657_BALMU|nr:B-lymphocyte antigen CD20-like [Balaenoptera musculus]